MFGGLVGSGWSVDAEDGKKDPWFIHAAGPLLAACGKTPAACSPPDNLGAFAVITGDSSVVSADIHDRMPVWLTAGQADEWLTAEPTTRCCWPASRLRWRPIASAARSTAPGTTKCACSTRSPDDYGQAAWGSSSSSAVNL